MKPSIAITSTVMIIAAVSFKLYSTVPKAIEKTAVAIEIDGIANEPVWQTQVWNPINQLWLGEQPTTTDFSGQFKLVWNEHALYLLAQITDDVLFDQTATPTERYWDDDCLEIFIDADRSGGNHLYNHNAFAYHLALDNQAVDIGLDKQVHVLDHIDSQWQRNEHGQLIWEVAIQLYSDSFNEAKPDSTAPLILQSQMEIGFMLAYCDNDGSDTREHFIGSYTIEPVNGDKNRGYIDASTFEPWILLNNQ